MSKQPAPPTPAYLQNAIGLTDSGVNPSGLSIQEVQGKPLFIVGYRTAISEYGEYQIWQAYCPDITSDMIDVLSAGQIPQATVKRFFDAHPGKTLACEINKVAGKTRPYWVLTDIGDKPANYLEPELSLDADPNAAPLFYSEFDTPS